MQPPEAELAAIDDAFALVLPALDSLDDGQARGPSLLPGWSRGHLLTHLARASEGDRRCVEGAARDEVVMKYPAGADGRAADIDAGAGRDAVALVADVVSAQRALMDALRSLPDDAWERRAGTLVGVRTMVELAIARRRELLVHLVDLDVGVEPTDLPRDYLDVDADWLAEFRPTW
ncbi:MAG: maleylpyruvate isomerase N-terminal domain-containing protein [Acidimicrobiia bacterium]